MNDTTWLNTITGTLDKVRDERIDYGITHVNNIDGSILGGLKIQNEDPVPSTIERIKYLEEYGLKPLVGEMIDKVGGIQRDWPAPTIKGYINCLGMLRLFLLGNINDKVNSLLSKMGFDYTGTIYGTDSLFVYNYSTEPTRIELYLSLDKFTVTEINRFNNSTFKEVKIPIDPQGLQYVFFQVFADLNRVDFNKFDFENLSDEHNTFIQDLLNLDKEHLPTDKLPVLELEPLNECSEESTIERKESIQAWANSHMNDEEMEVFEDNINIPIDELSFDASVVLNVIKDPSAMFTSKELDFLIQEINKLRPK